MFGNGQNFRKDVQCSEKDLSVAEFFHVGPVLNNDPQTPPPQKESTIRCIEHTFQDIIYIILYYYRYYRYYIFQDKGNIFF